MVTRIRFVRMTNSIFQHMGVDGFYQTLGAEKKLVRVILRQPDPLFELGDRHIVVEQYRVDVRVSELSKPIRGDIFTVNNNSYRIEEEPRLDQHQLVWLVDVLPTTIEGLTDGKSNSRLRVR